MAIPEGYRLLTSEDVGKTFGVDLESVVYFDTSITDESLFSNLGTFFKFIDNSYNSYIQTDDYGNEFFGYIKLRTSDTTVDSIMIYHYIFFDGFSWIVDSYTFTNGASISSIDLSWDNTWFYVKDIATDPYNITLTKPKLTVKCANATMEKDLVVQAKVYDGTVEGGEAGSGITPSGTLDITENGTYDVTNYASANVNVEGSGTTVEPPYTSTITNSGSAYFGGYIPDENGILTTEFYIAPGETITIKHYGLFTWYRDGYWSSSWGGQTYAPDTFGTRYCIQTGSTENVYTLSVSPSASSGGAS